MSRRLWGDGDSTRNFYWTPSPSHKAGERSGGHLPVPRDKGLPPLSCPTGKFHDAVRTTRRSGPLSALGATPSRLIGGCRQDGAMSAPLEATITTRLDNGANKKQHLLPRLVAAMRI